RLCLPTAPGTMEGARMHRQDPARADAVWELPPELWARIEPLLMSTTDGHAKSTTKRTQRRGSVLVIKDPFYISAPTAHADERTRVLKQGETFAVFDHYGDVRPAGRGEEGLYHEGTRYLSALLLKLGEDRPLFLSSTVKEDNAL